MTHTRTHTDPARVSDAAAACAFNLRKQRCKPSLTVDRTQALRYLGHGGQELSDDLIERLEACAQRCEEELSPLYTWRTYPIDWMRSTPDENGTPVIRLVGSSLELPGHDIAHLLDGASFVTLLACTLGATSERSLAQLGATNALDAMLYGACANALIENVAETAQDDITHAAEAQGLFARMRFSPGYGDLPLDIQPAFLSACEATRTIGLSCSKSLLLVPTKSITAVIGLFDGVIPHTGPSPCQTCVARDYCSYLEKGITCHGN